MQPPFTPQELAEAAAYHRAGYILRAARDGIDIAVIGIWLGIFVRLSYRWAENLAARLSGGQSPIARRVDHFMQRLWRGPGWDTALLFSTFNYFYLVSAFVPIGVYFGYIHAHAFGMSVQSASSFVFETLLTNLKQLAGHLAVTLGLLGLARRYARWWLIIGCCGGALLVATSVLEPLATDRISPHRSLSPGPLRDDLLGLAERAHARVRDIEVKEVSRRSVGVEAYFAGKGPTRTIVLSDTLVQQFTPSEIEAVVAHEAGHVSESRWLSTFCLAPSLILFLWCVDRLLRVAVRRHWLGATDRGDPRLLPWITMLMYLVMTVGYPVAAPSLDKES